MKYYSYILILSAFLLYSCQAGTHKTENNHTPSPEEIYGELFYDVQSQELFSDSKYFVDAVPLTDMDDIKTKYAALEPKTKVNIKHFVKAHFELPDENHHYTSDSVSVREHISQLWEVLKRPADQPQPGTLIPLPHPYVVPGGRFREIYYWDSYFTMLGLAVDRRQDLIRNMIDNFSYLIDKYGHIPNGNRTYYLSRSQPPFYSLMIDLLARTDGDQVYSKYLPSMEKEYAFWMDGAESRDEENPTWRRVVRMPDGKIMNRYWDDRDTPRPESFREDIETAELAEARIPGIKKADVYRNIRAAAESGWDFSSRWLEFQDGKVSGLYTIRTTDIIPVDLNSLMYHLEQTLSKAYAISGDTIQAATYRDRSIARKTALLQYCYDQKTGFFMDFNFKHKKITGIFSLAGLYPLFFGMAEEEQASRAAAQVSKLFMKPGGLVTTLYHSGEQWDAPNGWAPLQWIGIRGLRKYGHTALADSIGSRWLRLNADVYSRTYKMAEKYNVEDVHAKGGGGEYPNQDGFGWTNGVFLELQEHK